MHANDSGPTKKEVAAVESMLDSSTFYSDRNQPLEAIRWASKASNYLPRLAGDPFIKEQIHTALARSLLALGADREAITHWHSLVFHRKKALGHYDLKCSFRYGAIGSKHLLANAVDSAFTAFRKAQRITNNLGMPVYHASSWNNLGMAYDAKGAKDSALVCYLNALEILEKGGVLKNAFTTAVYENIAHYYYGNHQLQKASLFYRKSITLLTQLPEVAVNYKAKHYLNLGDYLSQTKGKPGLKGVLDTAEMLVNQMPENTLKDKSMVQLIGIRLAQSPSNATELLRAQNHYLTAINEALHSEKNKTIDGLTNYKQSLLKQQQEITQLELASREETIQGSERTFKNRVAMLSLLVLGILIALLLIVALHKRKTNRLLLEQKMAALEIENRRLEEDALTRELASKKSDLVDLALDNSRKLEFNKTVLAKLKEFQDRENNDIHKVIRKLENEFNHQSQTESRINTLQGNVDKVNKAFYQKIKDEHPALTQGELELCGYLRLQLSGKEIANLRNVNPDSITKAKQRLRKKLALGPNADLYAFVQSF